MSFVVVQKGKKVSRMEISIEHYNKMAERLTELEYKLTEQPERKKGKWINHRNDEGHNIADCDQCGHAIQWFDDDERPRFCCMCGADNREGDG